MPIRPMQLPSDLLPLGEMLVQTFQYPENPEWGVQDDEQEDIAQTVRGLKRFWPILRLLQVISPPMRDMFRGFVWEQDDQIVAAVLFNRRGATDDWTVGTVGVLPGFRRRGLARRLLEHSLAYIRSRSARRVTLGVIDRNVPAYALYRSLGFEAYGKSLEYEMTPAAPPQTLSLPPAFEERPLARLDWRPKFELERRLTPESVARYETLDEGRFRPPPFAWLFVPFLRIIQARREQEFQLREQASGRLVGRYHYNYSTKNQGICSITVRAGTDDANLAPYMISRGLHAVTTANPGRRVEIMIRDWMPNLAEAAEAAGFTRRKVYDLLGLVL